MKKSIKKRKTIKEIDTFLKKGGMRRAANPGGALQQARRSRDARVEPKGQSHPRGKEKLEIIRAKGWKKQFPWFAHGFSTRTGGVSTIFGGHDLNLGFATADDRVNVEKNRRMFFDAVNHGTGPSSLKNVACMKQIHSSNIHRIQENDLDAMKTLTGDGVITNLPGVMLTVQAADCVPILLVDVKKKIVGAVHAGWRGTVKRIVEKAIGMMQMEYGSKARDIHAAIGPCIGACCYAVGDEVVNEFQSQFPYATELFSEVFDDDPVKKKYPLLFMTARAPGHGDTGPQTHLDLVEANRRQLLAAGVQKKNIWASGMCTSCDTTRFFSHRKEHGFTGRSMAAIQICD